MKTLKTKSPFCMVHLVLILPLLTFSCADDTSDGEQTALSGHWKLVSLVCCDLPKEEYASGKILWKFDHTHKTVTITNNVTFDESSEYSFQTEGTYAYTITDNTTLTISYLDRSRAFEINNTNQVMTLSQNPDSDGVIMTFTR